MDNTDNPGLLKFVFRLFAQKRPETLPRPASLGKRKREAWLRADSFLQHEEFGDHDPEDLDNTLRAFEDYVEDDSGGESSSVSSALDKQPTPVLLAS